MKPEEPTKHSENLLKGLQDLLKEDTGKLNLIVTLGNSLPRIQNYMSLLEEAVAVFWKEVQESGVGFGDDSYHGLDKKKIDRAFEKLGKFGK